LEGCVPDSLVEWKTVELRCNPRSPGWVTCAPVPSPEREAVVEMQAVIAIGLGIPAMAPTID
jgi:hypothetical protein